VARRNPPVLAAARNRWPPFCAWNGLAVPEVDELASVSLDLWAAEKGYNKLQVNLLGL